jgi:hypothetical protein
LAKEGTGIALEKLRAGKEGLGKEEEEVA